MAPPDSALNLTLTMPATSYPTSENVKGLQPLNELNYKESIKTQLIPSLASTKSKFGGTGLVVL